MSKQYISTVSVAQAHELDIYAVEVAQKYTITVSGDGYVNFWDNKVDETVDPLASCKKILVDKIGLHHVALYEAILVESKVKVVVVVVVAFSGQMYVYHYVNDDIETLKCQDLVDLSAISKYTNCWAPAFYQDPNLKQDLLVVTQALGETVVYQFGVSADPSTLDVAISLEEIGIIAPPLLLFPNSIAVSSNEEKRVAIGYSNGDVLIFDLLLLKPIYTFKSTDVQHGSSSLTGSSLPRSLKFLPGGLILVVARDNQLAGSITLYDAKYGENVGLLTTPLHSSKTNIGGFAHDGWILGLSFDSEGKLLASCGFDKAIRVWNMENRERVATINVSYSDFGNTDNNENLDNSVVSGISFIKKGVRGGIGGDTNEGLCAISFDRGVRWYREAGGI